MDIYDETFIRFWKSASDFGLKFIMIVVLQLIFTAIIAQRLILMFGLKILRKIGKVYIKYLRLLEWAI